MDEYDETETIVPPRRFHPLSLAIITTSFLRDVATDTHSALDVLYTVLAGHANYQIAQEEFQAEARATIENL